MGKRDPKATKPTEVEAKDEKERKSFFCRAYTVFNVEQCDGLKVPEIVWNLPEVAQDERCEAIVTGWATRPGLELDNAHEGRAYYRPRTDTVHMPIDNDGLALTINTLRKMGGESFRVLLTRVPPPPEPEGPALRAALLSEGVPMFSVDIPRLKVFDKAFEMGTTVNNLALSSKDQPRAERVSRAE